MRSIGPRQANLVLIAYASSEGSGEPAHPRSLARTFAARSYKQWVKRNLQTESQIPSPSEWLGMRSWNVSWRNARRHKFAWRGSIDLSLMTCNIIIVMKVISSVKYWPEVHKVSIAWKVMAYLYLSHVMRKPVYGNYARSACASTQSDQHLVVPCLDIIISPVSVYEISSL